jgi:hypothetical protein
MNNSKFTLNNNIVVVIDAPIETTHCRLAAGSKTLTLHKRSKDLTSFDLAEDFDNAVLIGKPALAKEIDLYDADLFHPVKKGHFVDFTYNSQSYPTACAAFTKFLIDNQVLQNYSNPFVIVLKKYS